MPPVNHRCAPQGCSGDDGNVFELTSAFTSASNAVQSRSPTHSTAVPRCIEAVVCVCLQSGITAVLQAIQKQSERESKVTTPTPTDQTPIPASYLSISFDAALTHCRISQLRDYPQQKTQSSQLCCSRLDWFDWFDVVFCTGSLGIDPALDSTYWPLCSGVGRSRGGSAAVADMPLYTDRHRPPIWCLCLQGLGAEPLPVRGTGAPPPYHDQGPHILTHIWLTRYVTAAGHAARRRLAAAAALVAPQTAAEIAEQR